MTGGHIPLPSSVRLTAADAALIEQTVEFIAGHDTASVIAELLPGLGQPDAQLVASACRFDHVGALIFPDNIAQLQADLRDAGLETGPAVPSVVVRERLSRRYQVPLEQLEVAILRAPVAGKDGLPCEIEIFALAATAAHGLAEIAQGERACGHESHVALRVHDHSIAPQALLSMLTGSGLVRDGGGYNGYIDDTVLYFRDERGRRLELIAGGRHA